MSLSDAAETTSVHMRLEKRPGIVWRPVVDDDDFEVGEALVLGKDGSQRGWEVSAVTVRGDDDAHLRRRRSRSTR
jgi:hypothetical protein